MKIENFTRQTVKNLRTELDSALAELSEKYGISINVGNARFSSTEVNFKLNINTTSDSGRVYTREGEAFERHKHLHGMSHLSVGDKVMVNGRSFILEGFNPRAKRYPIEISAGGSNYKCSISQLLASNS